MKNITLQNSKMYLVFDIKKMVYVGKESIKKKLKNVKDTIFNDVLYPY